MSEGQTETTVKSLSDDREGALAPAEEAIRAGECIVLPTDTVYGIGADAFNADAVARLLAAKGRGRDMPPPVLIAESMVLMSLGRDVSDHAKALASALWPGPLTIIVPAQPSLNMDLGDTDGTIAIRVPNHDQTRELLRRTGPMAVSSANRSGQPAARTVDDAQLQLTDSVSVYLDGGECSRTQPSTIVDFSKSDYGVVLRRGAIPVSVLRETVPFLEDGVAEPEDAPVVGDAQTDAPAPVADTESADTSDAPGPSTEGHQPSYGLPGRSDSAGDDAQGTGAGA